MTYLVCFCVLDLLVERWIRYLHTNLPPIGFVYADRSSKVLCKNLTLHACFILLLQVLVVATSCKITLTKVLRAAFLGSVYLT